MSQKIFIKTFGCQMNEYDSNRIFDSVKKIGFKKTDNYADANCYLLNTCHIRDKAKEKDLVISEAKEILDVENVIASIILVEDLRIQKD